MPIDKNADNIQVMVRVRPFNSREMGEEAKPSLFIEEDRPNSIIVDTRPEQKRFNFDWVGGDNTTQDNVFEVAGKAMVQACLEGYNCCIFAYGQTGAGKTYTMQGRGLDIIDRENTHRGLQPRVFDYIFAIATAEMKDVPDTQYLVSCSYLEIYNEQIKDLLDPQGLNLQIREDLKKGVYVEGLKEEVVTTSDETIGLLQQGATNRHVGSTNMNSESSRSHSVFTMTIESKKCIKGMIHVKTSKFHFVDLAGSERQKQTASAGERLKEAGNINKSLLVLGQVINSLVEIAEGKQRHIRYRDSKLTFILKDSLGGNAKTCLIANISPAYSAFSETLSTLKFAQRAKMIKNRALINEDSSGSLEVLKREVKKLRDELAVSKERITYLQSEQLKFTPAQMGPLCEIAPAEIPRAEMQQKLIELNRNSVQVETLLKENLEIMRENEILLQTEIAKKDDYVNVFKSAIELYNANELQYRSMLSLHDTKIDKWKIFLKQGIAKGADFNPVLLEENTKLLQERDSLMEIVKNTPLVMKVFMDNVEFRDKMETLEGETNPTSPISIVRQLEENAALLKETLAKIEEDIKLKRNLTRKMVNMGWINNEEHQTSQLQLTFSDISRIHLKLEDSDQSDRMHLDMLDLKQFKDPIGKGMEIEREMRVELEMDKGTNLLSQVSDFRAIQFGKMSACHKGLDEFAPRDSEAKDPNNCYKDKYENILALYREMEGWVKTTLEEKENIEKSYKAQLEEKVIKVSSLEENINSLMEELAKSKEEINDFSNKLIGLGSKEDDYEATITVLYSDNAKLKEKLSAMETGEVVIKLEEALEKEKQRANELLVEKCKLQEEYDSLNSTLSYNVNDLKEKRRVLNEAHLQLSCQKKTTMELECKVKEQEDLIKQLQDQIYDQNKPDSPYNMIMRENSTFREEIQQLHATLRSFESNISTKDRELQSTTQQTMDLSRSVENYARNCQEALDKIETKNIQIKELQTNLDIKTSEAHELQREISNVMKETSRQKEELEMCNKMIELAQNNVVELQTQLQKNQKDKETVQSGLDAKLNEVKSLTSYTSQLSSKIQELEAKLERAEKEYQVELNKAKAQFFAIEDTCQMKTEEVSAIRKALLEAENSYEKLEREKAELLNLFETFKKEISHKLEEYEKQIASKNAELMAQQTKLNEFAHSALDTKPSNMDLQRKQFEERSPQERHRSFDNNTSFESYSKKENAYKEQIDELTRQLNQALEQLAQKSSDFKELQLKTNNLDRELAEKDNRLREYIDNMDGIKSQLDGYMELTQDFNANMKLKQENERLKNEVSKHTEFIQKVNKQAVDHFKAQEEEIKKIKASYIQLENQHQFIMATATLKDNEITKQREEIKLVIMEKWKLGEEIKQMQKNEERLQKQNEENETKIKKLQDERYNLMLKFEGLNKGDSELNTSISGVDARLKNLQNKYKDKVMTLKEEKDKLADRLNNAMAKNDKLQKKIDELAGKAGLDASKILTEIEEVSDLEKDLAKTKSENRVLNEIVEQVNCVLTANFYKRQKAPSSGSGQDINATLENMQELLSTLSEKENEIKLRERELEAKSLHYNIMEKELSVIKQKYQLTHTTQFRSLNESPAPGLRANKENQDQINLSQGSIKQEMMSNQSLDFHFGGTKGFLERSNTEIIINGKKSRGKTDENERYERGSSPIIFINRRPNKQVIKKPSNDKYHRSGGLPCVVLLDDDPIILNDDDRSFDGQNLRKKVKLDQ